MFLADAGGSGTNVVLSSVSMFNNTAHGAPLNSAHHQSPVTSQQAGAGYGGGLDLELQQGIGSTMAISNCTFVNNTCNGEHAFSSNPVVRVPL